MTQALLDQALALHGQGRLAEAEGLYGRILAADPSHLPARHMLGVALAQQGRNAEALALIGAVIAADPRDALALANCGNVLNALGRREEALDHFDRALALQPGLAQALTPRANVLQMLGRYDQALAAYDVALAQWPGDADLLNNRGLSLQNLRRLPEARDSFERAVAAAPDMANAHLNLGLWHLLQQDLALGLPLYEWRKQLPEPVEAREYRQPLWTGMQDARGKTIFAYVEQGLGDTIQFYRYVAPLIERGARVVLSVHDSMLALLRSASPAVELVGWGKTPDDFDFHIPLMSIPLALGLTDIAPSARYLAAEPQRVAEWRQRIGDRGTRIGIAWQGNDAVLGAEGKSFPLAALAGVAKLPGVRLINLQKNAGAEQLAEAGVAVEQFDFDTGKVAFLDTAAIMENLDLVISADSAPAHLAGALGVPCWVALKYVPDWRWFLDRADTPWYPSLRLFRQPHQGDWAAVFREMEAAISALRRS